MLRVLASFRGKREARAGPKRERTYPFLTHVVRSRCVSKALTRSCETFKASGGAVDGVAVLSDCPTVAS